MQQFGSLICFHSFLDNSGLMVFLLIRPILLGECFLWDVFAFASDLLTKKVTNLVIRLNHNEITLNQIKPEQNLNVLL